jgi:hypothetical protein
MVPTPTGGWPSPSFLGDLPPDTWQLVLDAVANDDWDYGPYNTIATNRHDMGVDRKTWAAVRELRSYIATIPTNRHDMGVDRQTWAAVRELRSYTVLCLRVSTRYWAADDGRLRFEADQQFRAFPNLSHLEWRSRDDMEQAPLLLLARRPLPAVFERIRSVALTGTPGIHVGYRYSRVYGCLGSGFANLATLRVDHKVGREDLEQLRLCNTLRQLTLQDAEEDAFARPNVLPNGLTCLRVLGAAEQARRSALSGWESLQELYMPHYTAYIYRADDLARLARLRLVSVFTVVLLDEHGEEVHGLQDLPLLAWTHLSLQPWRAFEPLLPLIPHLERAIVSPHDFLILPHPALVTAFLRVFDALDGKFLTPHALAWAEDASWGAANYPDVRAVLPTVLSKAADRLGMLTLVHMRVDKPLLDVLRTHAPQLRHLTLYDCLCDPAEVARACNLDRQWAAGDDAATPRHMTLILR